MFRYYFPSCGPSLRFILLLFSLVCCHTAYGDGQISSQPKVETSLSTSATSSDFKRNSPGLETIDAMDQSPFPTVSDNMTNSGVSLNNRTLQTLKPSNMSGGFNITQSLPAWMNTIKTGALERTGFVVLGFMMIIVGFFVIRGIRLRNKKSKSRKYGIIKSTDIEMEPLDNDDDDDDEEDTTLFDAQQKYSLH